MTRPHHRTGGDRGVVIPLFALLLTTILLMVSFAVDLGRLRSERRNLQADADAIALDAVQKIQGLTMTDALAAAITEANASADRNAFPVTLDDTHVSVGFWNVDTQQLCPTPVNTLTDPDSCSTPDPIELLYPDAVQIDLSSTIPMYFDFSADERSVQRTAVAVARAQTRGQLGSVFGGIQLYDPAQGCAARADSDAQMTFMNHLFTEYFDIEVSGGVGAGADTGTVSCDVTGPSDGLKLDALSYQGLAFSQVTLGELASQFGLASPEQLLASNVEAADLFTATADALDAHGNVADSEAAANLRLIAAAMDTEADGGAEIPGQPSELPFGQIASGGTPADCADPDGEPKPCAAEATLNVLQLIHAAALAIDGENFAAVEMPINVPFGGTTITPRISIIETPQIDMGWKYAGQDGPRTAQIKIAVDIPLNGVPLDLSVLGISNTALASGNIPLVIEVARADSEYPRIGCSALGKDDSFVDMLVDTGAVSIGFGGVSDADLQNGGDVTLTASSMLDGSISFGLPLLPTVTINLGAMTEVSERQTWHQGLSYDGGHGSNVNLLGASETHTFMANEDPPFYETPWYRYDGGLSGTSVTDGTFATVDYNALSNGTLVNLLLYSATQATIEGIVADALQPVMTELGDEFVDNILSALGVTLAGADARILDVRCQVPALANRG